MFKENKDDYKKLMTHGTGSHYFSKNVKDIIFPFGKYKITVRLDQNNKFLEINRVEINKDFRSYKQKMDSKRFHDVEKFYKE